LRHEDVPGDSILLTGKTIVEATAGMVPDDATACGSLGAEPNQYVLAVIQRPENTDAPQRLQAILDELSKLGLLVLFSLHPRTCGRRPAMPHSRRWTDSRLSLRRITAPSSAWPVTPA
jgi:UDP-N-acetylglucosamine 2-epimerase